MRLRKPSDENTGLKNFYDDLRRERQQSYRRYRDRALSLFSHVCAVCGREFAGKNLRELTVHHKDHDHDNNPPDGSNWELLCMYCHDELHERGANAQWYGESGISEKTQAVEGFKPFEGLDKLLSRTCKEDETDD
jgi:hypothetical protein